MKNAPDVADEALEKKIAENDGFIAVLESGSLHLGQPFEGRNEAKVFDLKRQNAMYRSMLDRRNSIL
jgi:hypothetical protein